MPHSPLLIAAAKMLPHPTESASAPNSRKSDDNRF
jgi:hypothetical protein